MHCSCYLTTIFRGWTWLSHWMYSSMRVACYKISKLMLIFKDFWQMIMRSWWRLAWREVRGKLVQGVYPNLVFASWITLRMILNKQISTNCHLQLEVLSEERVVWCECLSVENEFHNIDDEVWILFGPVELFELFCQTSSLFWSNFDLGFEVLLSKWDVLLEISVFFLLECSDLFRDLGNLLGWKSQIVEEIVDFSLEVCVLFAADLKVFN